MNHSYRLIWSHRSQCFIAVGEHARRRGKSAKGATVAIATALAAAIFPVSPASAGPVGGVIINGSAGDTITRPDAKTTVINQTGSRLAINWTSFSSASGERITFSQPNSSSIALNRVVGGGRSELMGILAANGQVFVINPNGVLFGPDASVDVGGLLASTLDIKSESVDNNGNLILNLEKSPVGAGTVLNRGKLTATAGAVASDSGNIALVGPRVINEGTISAVQGQVLMAAGDKVTLQLAGRSLAGYTISRGSLEALVENSGTISANSGDVTLDARAADKLSQAVVNHTGVIEAQTLQRGRPGSIQLLGGINSDDREAGDMLVAGRLDVSAPNGGNGGSVTTSAARVNIDARADVRLLPQEPGGFSKGTWTNTSRDFLIAEGGGPETNSSIGAVTVSNKLNSGSQTYATPDIGTGTGDLYVNAKVKWDTANPLILKSSRSIYINADIEGKNASLELQHGQTLAQAAKGHDYFVNNGSKVTLQKGQNFTVVEGLGFASRKYYVITDVGFERSASGMDLQGLSNLTGLYVLGNEIDASATKDWNGGTGFVPISQFHGTLDGLGNKIKNLTIKNAGADSVGLFNTLAVTKIGNTTFTGRVQNLTLENAMVTKTGVSDDTGIGALAGTNNGEIFNVHATMSVRSFSNNAGGLVGINNGLIKSSSAVGVVESEQIKDAEATGGLVGRQQTPGRIIDSYAMVNVTGNRSVGGLVGLMDKSKDTDLLGPTVVGSYAGVSADRKGSVDGKQNTGGLIGYLKSGRVSDSYAAVPVTGGNATGGLVGLWEGAVQNTYATGVVKQSAGADPSTVGGLIGSGSGTASTSVWNTETTGQNSSRGGDSNVKGLTTRDMRSLSTFTAKGWKIDADGGTDNLWRIYDGQTSPLLRSFLVAKNVETKSVTYNAQTQIGCTGTPCADGAGDPLFTAASGQGAGTYAPYSMQQGYDIRGGKLTITPFLLTPTAISPEKIYDGDPTVSGKDLLSVTPLDAVKVSVGYTAQYDNENASSNKTVNFSDIKLVAANPDTIAGNYEIANTFSINTGKIRPKEVSLLGTTVNDKEYDGNTATTVQSIGTLSGILVQDNEKVSVRASGAAFVDENAGTNKAVTVSGVALTGDKAANYTLAEMAQPTATIRRRVLTLSGTTVDDKEYDGNTAATVRIGALNNLVDKDKGKVTVSASGAAFVDENAGTNKAVTVSDVALAGDKVAVANYTLADTTVSTNATIRRRVLTLSGTTVDDKEYDGTTAATLNSVGTLSRIVDKDKGKVTVSASGAAFGDKNAGANKAVTVSGVALADTNTANYTIADTVKTTATIQPRPLAVRAQGVDKTYDGNTNATVNLGDDRIEGDKLDLRYAKASFADSNAGSSKTVTVAGIAASGADAGNYVADTNAVTTASVSKAPLTITANPDSKAFDARAYRGGNGVTYAGFAAGENAAVLNGQASYGGDAQGAVNIGSYHIAPAGYASQNYAIVYVDGKLTIQSPSLDPAYQAAGTVVAATEASMSEAARTADGMRLLSQQATLRVAECGTRLPNLPLAVVVDCNEGRVSGSAGSVSGF